MGGFDSETSRRDLRARAIGATVADRMIRLLLIECSDFMPAAGGYALLRAEGRQTNPSTPEVS